MSSFLDRLNDKLKENVVEKASDFASGVSDVVLGGTSIDDLRSAIVDHGGLPTSNRYNVMFTPPKATLLNVANDFMSDPLAGFRQIGENVVTGAFDLSQVINDPRDLSILCQAANFPDWTVSTAEYKRGGKVEIKYPYGYMQGELKLNFLLTNDYYVRKIFDKWISGVVDINADTISYRDQYATDIVLQHLNKSNVPIYTMRFENAYPVSVGEVQFDQQSRTDYVNLEIVIEYEKYVVEDIFASTVSVLKNGYGELELPGGESISDSLRNWLGSKSK